jgi:hypothetical protein
MANIFINSVDDQAVLSRMQELCGINPKTWKDITDAGTFRECVSYKDYGIALLNYYRQSKEAKDTAAKARLLEQESKPRFKNTELRDQLDQVTIAEKIQKIRLDKAKEQDLWIKNSLSRGELVDKAELEQLMFPLFTTMVNILRHSADTNPELQSAIDKCIGELYAIGESLDEQAIGDSSKYVKTMLDTTIYVEEIINTFEAQDVC